nr:Chain C, G1/S-specific cyclin-D2 [Homo sapiens]
ETSPLTAEKL